MPLPAFVAHSARGMTWATMLALSANPVMAQNSDRWIADEVQSLAKLPRVSDAVSAATLTCSAQKWTLALDLAEADGLEPGTAEMRVDASFFEVKVAVTDTGLAISIPREALDPLKRGVRWTIDFSGKLEEKPGDLTLSLRGSRLAINAMEGTCSLRDMSAYQPVTFSPYSSYLSLARELREDDLKAFTVATTAQAKIDAAMAEFGDGRRVLFTRLCGSSWYFGASGCNITGFAPDPAAEGTWRVVYDTENKHVFTDPRSAHQGWRDIVTLPAGVGGNGKVWRWSGETYALEGDLPPQDEDESEKLPLRLSQD